VKIVLDSAQFCTLCRARGVAHILWQPNNHYRCLWAKNSCLHQGYTVFNAQGSYYSVRVITQPKETSLLRKGGDWGWASGGYCSPDPCSDFREGGSTLEESMCACVCVCMCVYIKGWLSQEGCAELCVPGWAWSWGSGRTTRECYAALCWNPAGSLLNSDACEYALTLTHTDIHKFFVVL